MQPIDNQLISIKPKHPENTSTPYPIAAIHIETLPEGALGAALGVYARLDIKQAEGGAEILCTVGTGIGTSKEMSLGVFSKEKLLSLSELIKTML